jgi:Zn-dependent protease
MARGVFGLLYVPRANGRVFEHLRTHCEGGEATAHAAIIGSSARVALGAAAFVVTVGVLSAPNPELWGVAAFVALFLQLAMWLHEFGHLLAMRWFGHKDATLVMVPFLGGAAIGARPSSTRFEKAIVALMGPALSGLIVLALAPAAQWGMRFLETGSAMVDWSRPDALRSAVGVCIVAFLTMAIPINLFNLAPVGMLDGGRAVTALTTGRASRALYAIGIFAILALAIAGSGNDQQFGAAVVFVSLTWAASLLSKEQEIEDLPPMTGRQLLVTLGLFAFTLGIYFDASRTLLPSFVEAVKTGIMGPLESQGDHPSRQTDDWIYAETPKRS